MNTPPSPDNNTPALPTQAVVKQNPFAYKAFTVLWLATVLSNIGTWIHDVGAGWLMTSLSQSSPVWVSLTQAATTLPVFLLALPAGALADKVNRKYMLMIVQTCLLLVANILGIVVAAGKATPLILLLFTFFMGVGAAMTSPVWQAIVPSLVPRAALQQAVAMNSVGVNISRAIGPVLAAVLIGSLGIAAPFFVNALSFMLVLLALFWWQPPAAAEKRLPPEALAGAVRAGWRYALHSELLRAPLLKAAGFFVFASAYWALLPLIAKQVLHGNVSLYGILLGCIGIGAIGGALLLPALRKRKSADQLLLLGAIGTILTLCVFALVQNNYAAGAVCLIAGASWIAVLTSLNTSVQISLPDWVRARGLAVFIMVFFGSQTLGSIIWGQAASHIGIQAALLLAAAGLGLAMFIMRRLHLPNDQTVNLASSLHWPEPLVDASVTHDRGPVMITVTYQIAPENTAVFLSAVYRLRKERLRDGAYSWGIFEDTVQKGQYLEYFIVASWLEHLRQHERVTEHDRDIQTELLQYHCGDEPPKVAHFVAPYPDSINAADK
ncbi:MFS transporter [Stenoxybacter acetivorans]|uniref:MFS transporter n=1 Tax=Stenoxybacter acetivorans TaxID=422441 RepID=UPI000A00B399|nr:MFS transporter [Stenoxybacter acetivorans]